MTNDLAADLAAVKLAEWTARALAAENASARKEHLLTMLSAAQAKEGRIIVAIGVDPKHGAIYLQSNHGDEDATLARLSGAVGPYLKLLSATIRAAEGKRAEIEANADELTMLRADMDATEDERDHVRRLLADLTDHPDRDHPAWAAADKFIRGTP